MRNVKEYINPLILGSAIVIAILFSIPFNDIIQQFVYGKSPTWEKEAYYQKDNKKSPDWEKKKDYDKSIEWKKNFYIKKEYGESVKYTFWLFLNTAFVFYIVAIFNYSWKNRFLKKASSRGSRTAQFVVSNFLLILAIAGVSSIFADLLFGWFSKDPSNSPFYQNLFERLYKFFYINNFPVLIALVFAHVLNLYQKSKTAEIENLKLKEEKTKAELASLKEQLSPHFFFNTLSSLSAVIRLDGKNEGLEFIDNLTQVYRYILESNQRDLVKLEDELEFLAAYFFLLEERFGDKLTNDINISADLYDTFIPPMALQLLVENAIQHNALTSHTPLRIRIYSEKEWIGVQNNLQKKKSGKSMGIGLNNLLKRYQLLANKDIAINENAGFFTVKIPVIR